MALVEFRDVWEMYRIKFLTGNKPVWEDFWALRGVSFSVDPKETVGIVGANGAGKSTLLKLAAGMLRPDKGEVLVRGKAAGLFELGAGFEPELTGRENVELTVSLFGVAKQQSREVCEKIAAFAELGRFIDAPVKCYSGGMFVRLAFAIAIHVSPDILLIDDTLAVGDEYFQGKCLRRIFEMKEQGTCILFVTHDVNMLRRLCTRALFLRDGRLVEDSGCERVAGFYAHTEGPEGSVALLESPDISVIFNRGRIYLRRKEQMLTLDPGLYANISVGGKWYTSYQADWKVTGHSPGSLTAQGKILQLEVTLTWKLRLSPSGELEMEMAAQPLGRETVDEIQTILVLSGGYGRWFAPAAHGEFPAHKEEERMWQEVYSKPAYLPALGFSGAPDSGLPDLLFSADAHAGEGAAVHNSGYLTAGRIAQYRCRLRPDDPVYFRGALRVAPEGIAEYFRAAGLSRSLRSGASLLDFDGGRISLSSSGKALTKGSHMVTRFKSAQGWHASDSLSWQVGREGDELVAKAPWHGREVEEEWRVRPVGRDSFLWEVWLTLRAPLVVEEVHASSTLSPEYSHWFDGAQSGPFPGGFSLVAEDVASRCIQGRYAGVFRPDGAYAGYAIRCNEGSGSFAKVFNAGVREKAREVVAMAVPPWHEETIPAGRHCMLRVEIAVGEECPVPGIQERASVAAGPSEFRFEKGRMGIFWKGVEVTRALGVYTSVRSQGRWHDSVSSARWQAQQQGPGRAVLVGKWDGVPLSQKWEVFLGGDNRIGLQISMEVDEPVELERVQANVMLVEGYGRWRSNGQQGEFPPFPANINDDWQEVWQAQAGHASVSAEPQAKGLPCVELSCEEHGPGAMLRAVNSDLYHRGRLLQVAYKDPRVYAPGSYMCFKGMIMVQGE